MGGERAKATEADRLRRSRMTDATDRQTALVTVTVGDVLLG